MSDMLGCIMKRSWAMQPGQSSPAQAQTLFRLQQCNIYLVLARMAGLMQLRHCKPNWKLFKYHFSRDFKDQVFRCQIDWNTQSFNIYHWVNIEVGMMIIIPRIKSKNGLRTGTAKSESEERCIILIARLFMNRKLNPLLQTCWSLHAPLVSGLRNKLSRSRHWSHQGLTSPLVYWRIGRLSPTDSGSGACRPGRAGADSDTRGRSFDTESRSRRCQTLTGTGWTSPAQCIGH